MNDTREQFAVTAMDLVDASPDTVIVYAEISGQYWGAAQHRHPDRVINVGIREQLMVNVGAGLALSGMFPIVHTFAPFLVERAYEQVKLGISHQDVDGILVSAAASVDMATSGRTHQTGADVALMAALPGFAVHVPGTADEVDDLIRTGHAVRGRHYVRVTAHQNSRSFDVADGRLHRVHGGGSSLVAIAVGPVLEATEELDATVLYTATVRPFDAAGLRAVLGDESPDVVLVEPYLAGTSAHDVSAALAHRPHRLLSLGFGVEEVRRYGTVEHHLARAGLDAAGIGASIRGWRTAGAA
ncbi:MAG: transketolase [Nakamurella sp.]